MPVKQPSHPLSEAICFPSRPVLVLLLLALWWGVLTACMPARPQAPPDEITVQLKWVHQAQFAGLYLAQAKGYYAAENLRVTFVEGGTGIDPITQVVSGVADIGIAGPEELLIRRSAGDPVIAVATIYQHSPVVFVVRPDSDIKRPADFVGRTVGLRGATRDGEIQFAAMMKRAGFSISHVEVVSHTYNYAPFLRGEIDSQFAYATSGLIRVRAQGMTPRLIWPDDYGVHLFSDTLFATDHLIAQKPDMIRRFVRATLRGWSDALSHAEEAVDATMAYAFESDRHLQTQMFLASAPLVYTGRAKIGAMSESAWAEAQRVLVENDLLAAPIGLGQVYTLAFLDEEARDMR